MALRAVSLCAGIGAHDLALRRWCRTVCYVERDAFAASCLVGGMENADLDRAPIFDDLCAFDGRAWRGVVDLISAGLPCQPYSLAGKRRGNDDERALWPELVRIVGQCEPAFVFIENTPDFLSHAEPVWRELRGLGFEWEEPLFATASHVGAIHARRRVFLLAAHADRARLAQRRGERGERGDALQERATAERSGDGASDSQDKRREWSGGSRGRRARSADGGHAASDSGVPERRPPQSTGNVKHGQDTGRSQEAGRHRARTADAADPARNGRDERRPEHARLEGRPDAAERRFATADTNSPGLESEWCGWVFDGERQTFRHDLERCNPRCRTRGSAWDSESPVCRVDAGYPFRSDLLRVLGNAVPPPQTELAFETLFRSFQEHRP